MTIDRSVFSRVIAVHNGKGGVFKTTLVANIAGQAAASTAASGDPLRILMLDLDPQAKREGLARDFGVSHASDEGRELYDAMLTGRPLNPAEFLEVRPNLELVCGGKALRELAWKGFNQDQALDMLATCLAPIAEDYDYVFIDTPPSNDFFVLAALGCARFVLMPTKQDVSSIAGTGSAIDLIKEALDKNPYIEPLGIVLTDVGVRSTALAAHAADNIAKVSGDDSLLFGFTYRTAEAISGIAREEGLLIHEMAQMSSQRRRESVAALRAREKARKEAGEQFNPTDYPIPAKFDGARNVAQDLKGITAEFFSRIADAEAREDH